MLKDNKLMDLQLFAESDDGDSGDIQDNQPEETAEEKDTSIEDMFANENFQKMFQSELDKRMATALKTNDKKWQKALAEEKKKANMTAEELQAEKERELAEREQQIREYELKLAKLDYFKEKNYNIELLDYVGGKDEEEVKANADKLVEVVNRVVQKAVEERLKQTANVPPKGSKNTNTITLEDIGNMSPDEINKIWDKLK